MNLTAVVVAIAEIGPILAFFIAGQVTEFFTAVLVLMLASILASILSWVRVRHIPWLPIISTLFVVVGGAVTLFFHEPDAIIIADTIYYALGAALLYLGLLRHTLLLKHLFQAVFAITDAGWRILTWRWIIFLSLAAGANETVRIIATPEFWVDYRFVKIIIVLLFATYQFTLARRYRISSESTDWGACALNSLPMIWFLNHSRLQYTAYDHTNTYQNYRYVSRRLSHCSRRNRHHFSQ